MPRSTKRSVKHRKTLKRRSAGRRSRRSAGRRSALRGGDLVNIPIRCNPKDGGRNNPRCQDYCDMKAADMGDYYRGRYDSQSEKCEIFRIRGVS